MGNTKEKEWGHSTILIWIRFFEGSFQWTTIGYYNDCWRLLTQDLGLITIIGVHKTVTQTNLLKVCPRKSIMWIIWAKNIGNGKRNYCNQNRILKLLQRIKGKMLSMRHRKISDKNLQHRVR